MKTIIEKLTPSSEIKLSLQSFIIGLLVGSMVVGYSVYNHLEKNYIKLLLMMVFILFVVGSICGLLNHITHPNRVMVIDIIGI